MEEHRCIMKRSCCDFSNEEIRKANQEDPVFTSRADLENAFAELGIRAGMQIVVHTAFSSLGHVDGGPETLCSLLQQLITEKGTILVPCFVRYPKDGEDFVFDPSSTPAGVGVVPEFFRKLPGVVRSWDPTHSFCVWGKDKEDFVRNHHKVPTMHPSSPLGILEENDGFVLLIGCHTAVTFMHVVETSCGAICLGQRSEEYPAIIGGKKVKLRAWNWRKGLCRALRHGEIYDFMRSQNTLSEMMLGRSHLMLFRLRDYRTAYERLLLAQGNGCFGCPIHPRKVKQCVPSDWDAEQDILLPTDAFTGDWFPL